MDQEQIRAQLERLIEQQATTLAVNDVFLITTFIYLLLIVPVLLAKPVASGAICVADARPKLDAARLQRRRTNPLRQVRRAGIDLTAKLVGMLITCLAGFLTDLVTAASGGFFVGWVVDQELTSKNVLGWLIADRRWLA